MFQPATGTLVLGRYTLERELARGGMSAVWVARDSKLSRPVAVKLMAPTWSWSSDARARFEREAKAVAHLQSPHVVQIFDYGVDRECPVIVMELLKGEDLRTRLKRMKRLSLTVTSKVVAQTARGLGEAHAAGIIHRDLKHGNLFFARSLQSETVKILDFGVAKAEGHVSLDDHATNPGAILGTPQFMSPEQARGRPLDHRTDLWSLGVIIYSALTGRLPFGGSSPTDILMRVCSEQFARPSVVAPDLPQQVDAFMDRALARDAEHRFGSARELAEAFARIAPVSSSSLFPPSYDVDDEVTKLHAEAPSGEHAGANFPSAPSAPSMPSMQSSPSMPSGSSQLSIGSAAWVEERPPRNPTRQLFFGTLAAMLLAGVAVAATVSLSEHDATVPQSSESPAGQTETDQAESDGPDETAAAAQSASAAPAESAAASAAASAERSAGPVAAKRATPAPARPTATSGEPKPSAEPEPATSSDKPKPDPYGSRF